MLFFALRIFAINYLSFIRMQFQIKTLQSFLYAQQQLFCFCFTAAGYNDVVGIPLEWMGCKVSAHPHIKGVMQTQVS